MYGNEDEVEDYLLFRYCYCPTVGATESTGVNLRIAFINGPYVTSKMA